MHIYIRKIINSSYFEGTDYDIQYKLNDSSGTFYSVNFNKYCKYSGYNIIIDTNKLFLNTHKNHLNKKNLWYSFKIDDKTAYCMFPNSDGKEILDALENEIIYTEDEWVIKNIIE